MNNLLLPFLEINIHQNSLPFGEAALYGIQMLFIGMIIVFSVLALLWIVLELSGYLFRRMKGEAAPAVEKKPAPVTTSAKAAASDGAELIAVFAAAIAAMESAPAAGFRVVSFKRK